MRLTTHSDYALRVLIYLGIEPGRRATIPEIAKAYGISRSHLTKVVHRLGALGYVGTVRGKSGGIWLIRPPARIRVGDVVRDAGERFDLVECFGTGGQCRIHGPCILQGILVRALEAFQRELDRHTLADLIGNAPVLNRLLEAPPGAGRRRAERASRRIVLTPRPDPVH